MLYCRIAPQACICRRLPLAAGLHLPQKYTCRRLAFAAGWHLLQKYTYFRESETGP